MGWIKASPGYKPELDHGHEIERDHSGLEESLFSDDTSIYRLYYSPVKRTLIQSQLDEEGLHAACSRDVLLGGSVEVFFAYRFLKKTSGGLTPHDANKLRLSPHSFRAISMRQEIPAAFIWSLSRYYLPMGHGLGYSDAATSTPKSCLDVWCFLPVRVQVACTDQSHAHSSSTAGSNQMDPHHYLHLPDVKVDLRGSVIAICSRINIETKATTAFVVNLMDGRWARVAQEPQSRIKEVLEHFAQRPEDRPRFFVHTVFLTSVLRWWTNSLNSINQQLIVHEKRLQQEMDEEDVAPSTFFNTTNRALHSIAAHLHRYRSDLNSIASVAADLKKHGHSSSLSNECATPTTDRDFDQILSQVTAISDFALELEKKANNVLALLFNQMQIMGDRQQIANGRQMQEILRATQEEAKLSRAMAIESRRLAQEMKKDSVAMKTIAVVTMFFLPGASFAALLSMPFFDNNAWLSSPAKIWLWVALAIPSTISAFAFYLYWKKRDIREYELVELDA